jgi:hypothetical protein
MAANRGMVAGSRGGVVTIRHDGDGGATVRSFRMRFSALRRARPLFPRFVLPLVSILAGGGDPSICGVAVRCAAGWIGSAPCRIGWSCGRCARCLGFVAFPWGISLRRTGRVRSRLVAVFASPPARGGAV